MLVHTLHIYTPTLLLTVIQHGMDTAPGGFLWIMRPRKENIAVLSTREKPRLNVNRTGHSSFLMTFQTSASSFHFNRRLLGFLGRSCRPPWAPGRVDTCSRSCQWCCSAKSHSHRWSPHTHSYLFKVDDSEMAARCTSNFPTLGANIFQLVFLNR